MKDKQNSYVMVSRYVGLATLLPTATLVGYAIGYLLDKGFGTHFLKIVFLVIGVVAGFVQLIRELTRDAGEQ